jgi:hypothetical protein
MTSTVSTELNERLSVAPVVIRPIKAEDVHGFLSAVKKAILLPLQVIFFLLAIVPFFSAPIWLFLIWVYLK